MEKDTQHIDIRTYIDRLLVDLMESHRLPHTQIRFQIDVDSVNVERKDTMVLCQLIKELVHNALRHAFKGRPEGLITITLAPTTYQTHILSVADDGVGMAAQYNVYTNPTDGLELLGYFVRQLKGRLTVVRSKGSRFEIEFPVK